MGGVGGVLWVRRSIVDNERELLAKWIERRDAEAFAGLVRRYAGLVYGVTLRVTRSQADAEDVCQECFVILARRPGDVGESLGGWLHAVARTRALNVVRARGRRKRHEEAAMAGAMREEDGGSEWPVDEAIAGLPVELREVVIGHYLEGRGQAEIAERVGVSQGTVSRRVERALEMLRERLAPAGVGLSVAMVAEELTRCGAVRAPAELVQRMDGLGRKMVWPWKKIGAAAAVVVVAAVGVAVNGRAGSTGKEMQMAMATTVAVQKDAGVVKGVEKLEWKIGNQCTFIGSMRAALQAMGDETSYNELMGVSGAAFRLTFAQPGWDYSSVDGMLGYDHGAVAMKALGYGQAIITGSGNPNEPTSAKVREEICRSIDAGRPVLGIDVVLAPEWGIIAGYEQGGRVWLCRSYFDQHPGVTLAGDGFVHSDRWPWIRVVFGLKGKMPGARESLIAAMKVAVTYGKEEEYFTSGGGGRYARGLTVYRVWAEGLEEEGRYKNEKDLKHHWSVNCFCYDALVDARVAAGVYLKAHARELEGEAGRKVAEAAGLYEQIGQRLQEARGTVVPIYKDGRAAGEWTAEMRSAQAELLRGCAELEKRAIGVMGEVVGQ